jgi:hypothetical protein
LVTAREKKTPGPEFGLAVQLVAGDRFELSTKGL